MASPAADRRLRGVIFDMDGVVVDSEPLSMRIIAEIISEHGGHVTPALLAGLAGVNLTEALKVAAARIEPGAGSLSYGRSRRGLAGRMVCRRAGQVRSGLAGG